MNNTLNSIDLSLIESLKDAKALDITTIDVTNTSTLTDFMIICTGTSSKHVQSIFDKVIKDMKLINIYPIIESRNPLCDWCIIDFGDCILHIMQDDARQLYGLEKIWS